MFWLRQARLAYTFYLDLGFQPSGADGSLHVASSAVGDAIAGTDHLWANSRKRYGRPLYHMNLFSL